ncbi:MAG: hypothetical protein V4438_00625 [Patescibacteria group bacterium]
MNRRTFANIGAAILAAFALPFKAKAAAQPKLRVVIPPKVENEIIEILSKGGTIDGFRCTIPGGPGYRCQSERYLNTPEERDWKVENN